MAGLALLGAAFNVLLDRLSSPDLINFFRSRKHDERLLKKLKLKLLGLNKVLNDAEEKQFTDRTVKEWLDELRDAVYHAEDLVDEIATEALRCKVEAEYQSGPNQVQSLISSFTKLFDKEIECKLEMMIDRLEDFAKEKDVLGLREFAGGKWSQTRVPTTSLLVESRVYGRENDKEDIMKLLLSDGESSPEIDVIPIVGMGGMGKTTLAQLLYNDCTVDEHFGVKAWACVSDIFDVESVTRTILEAVNRRASDVKDLNSLQVELKKSLSGKKFLIVLDDVWNENYVCWDVLMAPFRSAGHGSKIIVTTRHESVASMMQTVPIHRLHELPEEHCWELFSRLAFEKGDGNAHPELKRIGKEIVKKCKGLPLAAKTLGGLLRSQRDVEGWNDILESSIWELPEEKSDILPALRLSYHYLPSHLKRCFAYCSLFFKDCEFNMKELVTIWIAEGFLGKPKYNKTVEQEGYECFRELLSRSFFQRSSADDSLYIMHDLVHDLAQYVMGDFCYRLEDGNLHGIAEKVRHFSYVRSGFCSFEKFKEIRQAKCLRTFLSFRNSGYLPRLSKKVVDKILSTLTCLRLLSLSYHQIEELPPSIGNLIHLRFLDLSWAKIRELPESVCTLYNLETLLLFQCQSLTMLPADLVKLISLRHVDLSESGLREMPMHISKLKDLQQLTVFVVGKCTGTGINELGEFYRLRGTISISGLQNVESSDALEAKMSEKKHLEKLALKWDSTTEDSQNERDVLEKLKPHTNLKHLEILNYGGTSFPTWLGDKSFHNMISLHLKNCENCFFLPPLGQMPSLKELTIESMPGLTSVGPEFYGQSGSLKNPFQSLETLRFESMSGWEDWCILDAGEFSQLQKLVVINCPKLIGRLPTKVPSLVGLEIRDCPNLVASYSTPTSIRNLVLKGCQGVQLERQGLPSVETMCISSFTILKELQSERVTLKNLKELNLEECPTTCEELFEEVSHCCTSLERLGVSLCKELKSIPVGLFPKLRSLNIWRCEKFETLLIPDGIKLRDLTSMSIGYCTISSFPFGGLPGPNLSSLSLSHCSKLKALPELMHTLLPSLQTLRLNDCPEIESFPEGGLPSKLDFLDIRKCDKLVAGRRYWGLQTLPSLTSFSLFGKSKDVLESFPEEWLLPPTLTLLYFGDLPNLKSLNRRALQLLASLNRIFIADCPQLQSLPEEGLPTSLSELYISRCPQLKPRCCREEGEDWHKIARIPLIRIDDEVISE